MVSDPMDAPYGTDAHCAISSPVVFFLGGAEEGFERARLRTCSCSETGGRELPFVGRVRDDA